MSYFTNIKLSEDDVPGAKLNGDFSKYTNVQLKRWLSCRGLKLSGNRAQLFTRCEDVRLMGKEIDIKIDKVKWYEKKVNELKDGADASVPTVLPITGWKGFHADFLPALFNYGHVYYWLVESMPNLPSDDAVSDEEDCATSITEKQLTRGRQYLASGFVTNVNAKCTNGSVHFKAIVDASMRSQKYSVTVSLSSVSGAVKDASCHCKASALSRCSHVAALLFLMSDCVGSKSAACTQLACEWEKGTKRKKPSSINDAVYTNEHKKDLIKFDPRPEKYQNVGEKSINTFLSDLSFANKNSDITSMWETVLVMQYEDYVLSDELKSLISLWINILTDNLQVTGSERSKTAIMVDGMEEQGSSSTWMSHRFLRMTASTAKVAMSLWNAIDADGTQANILRCFNFLNRHVWGIDNVTTYYMQRGIKVEEDAREIYSSMNPDYSVTKSGLWVNQEYPQLACSPDGLVHDPVNHSHGLLEIKCLKLLDKYSVAELVKSGDHAVKKSSFHIENTNLILKESHPYYHQIQFQLGVTGFDWCDFVLYCTKGPPSVQRIYPNRICSHNLFDANLKLWKALVTPEVFEKRVPRRLMPFVIKS